MVELACGQCEGEIELPDREYGEYSCPHCDTDFEYKNDGKSDFIRGIVLPAIPKQEGEDPPMDRAMFGIFTGLFTVGTPIAILILAVTLGIGFEASCVIVLIVVLAMVSYGFSTGNSALGAGALAGVGISGTAVVLIGVVLVLLLLVVCGGAGYGS